MFHVFTQCLLHCLLSSPFSRAFFHLLSDWFFFPALFYCFLIGPKGGSRDLGLYERIVLLLGYSLFFQL